MIPSAGPLDQSVLTLLRDHDPLVQRYRAFFALLDWSQVPNRSTIAPWPGPTPHPPAAYIKALLVKLCEHKAYITQLRTFLVEHPLLVLELGFRPVLDSNQLYGFDVERTVPGARWLRHQQRTLDPAILQALLHATVQALQQAIPDLGTTVAIDVKHIYAWVAANNPKAYVTDRYDPARQPTGDPDCRLGVKRSANQERADGTTIECKQYLWGYGTGIATALDPQYGDVVLAEVTLPFNEVDVTYYTPVYEQLTQMLGHPPTNVTADAAFDAWYVYDRCAAQGGVAAVPLNLRGHAPPDRLEDGTPRCPTGQAMVPSYRFAHTQGYQAQIFRCPLLHPQPTGATCAHEQFAKGGGCIKYLNISAGGRQRVELDRTSAEYAALYRQRTSAERINSQATAWGIERPKVRNRQAVHNLNTLTYIVINVQGLQRGRAVQAQQQAQTALLC
jgi:hypothetical protein